MEGTGGDSDYYRLLDEAQEQLDAGRHDEAFRLYDEVSDELATATDSGLRVLAVFALYEKAWALKDLGRSDEMASTTALILARYECAPEREIEFYVGAALLLQAERLIQRRKYSRALQPLDDALARSFDSTETRFRWIAACALAWKIKALTRSFRLRAMAQTNELLNEYLGPDPDPAVLDGVLHIMGTRSEMYLQQLRVWHGGSWIHRPARGDSDVERQ